MNLQALSSANVAAAASDGGRYATNLVRIDGPFAEATDSRIGIVVKARSVEKTGNPVLVDVTAIRAAASSVGKASHGFAMLQVSKEAEEITIQADPGAPFVHRFATKVTAPLPEQAMELPNIRRIIQNNKETRRGSPVTFNVAFLAKILKAAELAGMECLELSLGERPDDAILLAGKADGQVLEFEAILMPVTSQ